MALKKAIPVTLELATLAMVLGLIIAMPVGVLSATRQDKAEDYVGRVVAVTGLSLPDFWLGYAGHHLRRIWFHWIPPIGYASFWDAPSRTSSSSCCPRRCWVTASPRRPCA